MNSLTPHLSPRLVAGVCAGAIGALGFAAPAMAQSSSTIGIDDCHVLKSPTSGVVWFYCGVHADSAQKVSANYKANIPTWKPKTVGPWSSRSGKVAFPAGGGLQTLKFAVKNKELTVKQVEKRVRVTLGNAHGATITDGVAKAAR